MERAGPQRTCLQRPHGGCETLPVRSELTVSSCQWPQGREGLLAQRALPSTHTTAGLGGGLRGPREGTPVSVHVPSNARGWSPDSGLKPQSSPAQSSPAQSRVADPGPVGLSRKMSVAEGEEEASGYWDIQILFLKTDAANQICIPQPKWTELSISLHRPP